MSRKFKFWLVVLFLFLGRCVYKEYQKPSRYRWHPSECAAYHYRMKVLNISLDWEGGGTGTLNLITGGKGWGNSHGAYQVGDPYKPVPSRLLVRWFSIPERKFYEGDFSLPVDKIEELLKKSEFNFIYPCLAPHGKVSLFIAGAFENEKDYLPDGHIDKFSEDVFKTDIARFQASEVKDYYKKYPRDTVRIDTTHYFIDFKNKEYIKEHGIPNTWDWPRYNRWKVRDGTQEHPY